MFLLRKSFLSVFAILLLTLSATAQTSITEDFGTETNNASTFSQGGFSFSIAGQLHVENTAAYGVNDDDQYLDVSNHCTSGNVSGYQGSFYVTAGGDIIVDSIYVFSSTNCVNWAAGTIVLRGYKNGSLVGTSTNTYASIPTLYSAWGNGFGKVTQPFGASTAVDSVAVTANSPLKYAAVDNITFRSAASPPSISSHPSTQSMCSAGGNATFSITASNTTSYQWQVSTNSGSTWSNISNGGVYSTATTASLTITSATAGMNGYQYRCKATGAVTPVATSNAATLNVYSAPATIISQPVNTTKCGTASASFTVGATGTSLTYQWWVSYGGFPLMVTNGSGFSGATSSTLTISPASSGGGGTYYCRVLANATGCLAYVSTNNATLTISPTPSFSANPPSRTICVGSNTTFPVTTNNATSYQWELSTNGGATYNNISNTGVYSNATTATLSITGATSGMNGYYYRCVATNTCGSTNSNAGTLTVESPITITSPNVDDTLLCNGTTIPTLTGSFTFGTSSVSASSYAWYVSSDGGATFGFHSSGTKTLSWYHFGALSSGYQFYATVTNACGTIKSDTGTYLASTSPAVTTQPVSSSINSGSNTSFTVAATGGALTYQWQVSTNSGSTWGNVANGGIYSNATTATLNLTGATTSVNAYQYRCVVSGDCTPPTASNAATLTVTGTAPSISGHPSNSSTCNGSNTSFSVTASGTALTYQWQWSTNSGSTWNNLSNGGIYSNVTTSTLNLTGATTSEDGYQYRCVVTGSISPAATSNAATLTINTLPAINTNPNNSTTCSGTNTTFTVGATGTALTYQWEWSSNSGATWNNVPNSGIYSNPTSATLQLTAPTTAVDGYQYRCAVSGTCTPSVTTTSATLTINTLPTINTNPNSSAVCNGGNTTFTVGATGTAITYQWEWSSNSGATWNNVPNSGIYSNPTTATLQLTGATTTNNGYQYRCAVGGTCTPSVTTTPAALTINTLPAITLQPSNSTACETTNTSFSVTATGTTLTYQWEWSVNSGATWNNLTNGGVYTNATTATLDITGAMTSMGGYQYRCAVGGTCTPSATSNPATLTVDAAPLITGQPANSTICNGDNTSFGVTATGTALTYQWEWSSNSGATWSGLANGGIYSNVTANTLNLTGATTSVDGYQYRCVVSGTCNPSETSTARTLTIYTPPAITTQPSSSTICSGSNTSFTTAATGNGLTYQWEVNTGTMWTTLSNGGIYNNVNSATLNLTGATLGNISGDRYRCIINGVCSPTATTNDAMLSITAQPTVITAHPNNSTICEGSNTTFGITATGSGLTYQWEWSANSGATWNNVPNSGIYSNPTTTTLQLTTPTTAVDGYQYRCRVGSTCNPDEVSNPVTLNINTLPAITLQPTNRTICEGSSTNFTTNATGTAITYQWQWSDNVGVTWNTLTNGGFYNNVTTNTLNITGALTAIDGFQYRCLVNGTCSPSTMTNPAELTINTLPALTAHPNNSTICEGSNTTFTAGATGTAITHQWQWSSNSGATWSNLANGGIYSDVTTTTLRLTGATTAEDGYQYRCEVGGTCTPSATTNPATLTINTLPALTAHPNNSTVCEGSNTSFTTGATGTAITYQWEWSSNSGVTWNNVPNSGIYSNPTTTTLQLTVPTTAVDGYQYRCRVSGTCTPSVTTTPATLTINTLPALTAHPNNSTVCEGSNTTFTAGATGSALTYQWEWSSNSGTTWNNVPNSGIYNNPTAATLQLNGVTTAVDGYQYRCAVGGACTPSLTTTPATLTINTLPAITTHPNNSTICEGSNTTFTAGGTGTAITYQWEWSANSGATWNNVPSSGLYSNPTSTVLILTGATTGVDGYQYRCRVSGTCTPSVTTTPATLTINTLPAIITNPHNSAICDGSNTTFTTGATGTTLTYQWQWSANSGTTWTDLTNTSIYSDVTTTTLRLTSATTTEDGYQYRCRVSGACTPSATTNPAILTINTSPAITTNPNNGTVCEGSNTTFTANATGTAVTYQWEWSSNSGTTWTNVPNTGIYVNPNSSTLQLNGVTTAENGYQYRCKVSGACTPSVTTTPATLTINTLPVVTVHPSNNTICETTNTTFTTAATGTAITYQWQWSSNSGASWNNLTNTGIYSDVTTTTLRLTGATTAVDNYRYRCVASGTCYPPAISNAAILKIDTAPVITIQGTNSTICTGDNTMFSIAATGTAVTYQWQWSANNGANWTNLTNTGIYSDVTTNTLRLTGVTTTVDGYQYRCFVNGTCSPNQTSNALVLTINTRPAVTSNPIAKVICEGNNTSYSITGTGTAITYQWQVNYGSSWVPLTNNSIYSGATANTLNITSAPASLNGVNYRCVVSGACTPDAISNSASLTIYTAPAITSHPVNKTICEGKNAAFFINATGTAITYQWEVSINNGTTWNNIANNAIYAGVTTRVLSLTSAPVTYNSYQYRCVVSGTCTPAQTTSAGTLTVNSNVALQSQTTGTHTICSGDNITFSAVATGTGVTYRWYINNGTQYVPLNNGGVYAGATTGTLSITGITAAPSAVVTSYFCKIRGTCSGVTTTAVYLKVNAKPAITSNPSSVTVCDSTNNIDFNMGATGTNRTYQWQVNTGSGWVNQIANSNISGTTSQQLHINQAYYSMNNYQYRCVVSGSCTPAVTSGLARLTVNPLLTPSLIIAGSSTDICVNESVTFTPTPTNGGTSPTYIWKKNNVNVATGNTYTSSSFANNDIISCQLTSNAVCPSPSIVQSNQVTMTVHQRVLPTIAITSDNGSSWCSGKAAIFRSTVTFEGATPVYQWKKNGVNVGTNAAIYTAPFLLDGDEIECELTSNYRCATPATVSSNKIKMTIIQTTKSSIVISPNPDSVVCDQATVTLYPAYTNGGATPTFQWMLNGTDIPGETKGTITTASLVDGDTVACRFMSSRVCVFPEISNTISFDVGALLSPDVKVSISFLGDDTYMFTAIPTNGGINPSYQWYKNATPIAGATQGTYTIKGLAKHDKIYVQMVSDESCVKPSLLVVTSEIKTTGVDETNANAEALNLYPNPNTGSFTITGNLLNRKDAEMHLTILNRLGQMVYEETITTSKQKVWSHEIDLADKATGSYLLRISYDGQQRSRTFVIIK